MGEVRLDKNEGDRWIQHYCSSHQILLVGEGDFSFSACLARKFGDAVNMIATSLDSKDKLIRCYPGAKTNLKELEERRCSVLHDVDVHTMVSHPILHSKSFDRIVFNFPHAGFGVDHGEDYELQILFHQHLVRGFLKSAVDMLTENGEIHITHKTSPTYREWKIEKLAEEIGLYLLEKVPFVIFIRITSIEKDLGSEKPILSLLENALLSNLQKLFIRVQMTNDKFRNQAMTSAVSKYGVISVAIEGPDKEQLVVIGEGVDVVYLTRSLQRKLRCASLLRVEEVSVQPYEIVANFFGR